MIVEYSAPTCAPYRPKFGFKTENGHANTCFFTGTNSLGIHSLYFKKAKYKHKSILKDQTSILYSNFRENRIRNMVLSPNGIITSDKLCCIYFDSSHFDQNEQQSEGL